MKTQRLVISKTRTKRSIPKGSNTMKHTEMVVYKTEVSKGKFKSQTKHEII